MTSLVEKVAQTLWYKHGESLIDWKCVDDEEKEELAEEARAAIQVAWSELMEIPPSVTKAGYEKLGLNNISEWQSDDEVVVRDIFRAMLVASAKHHHIDLT